ncbi:serine palmitoyltransferase 1 [Ctenocephalides felis]|uniref:serine palmitoyltransferase 1 n=1 Tax=Ctenocephalides felis TaxID=7515 RepID=UPI000E6E11C3|nr:serine palmitoyltransferase 1 [Ctenocephalides felis]
MLLDIIIKALEAPLYTFYLQFGFLLLLLWFIFYNKHKTNTVCPLDVQKCIDSWQPEELVSDVNLDNKCLFPKIVTGRVGHNITVEGKKCLNFATHDYLSLLDNQSINKDAIDSLYKYGVGSCGPRGFYGTVDVHLELEERLAKYMNMEEAVVYSYGFSTIASAIPAYSKRGDLIFIDEKVSFAAQKGLDASRSTVIYFKHNDMKDLEEKFIQQEKNDLKNLKKATRRRRFLIVEGIYMNTGNICPLPELVELKKRYKARLFVDETVSLGTLGKTGRGVTEYFNVNRDDIDLIIGSLDWAVASIGGFCVGSSFIVEHQRLSGLGYCFSASLPPLLARAAISALDYFEGNSHLFKNLQDRCKQVHNSLQHLTKLKVQGDELSPVKHLYMQDDDLSVEEQDKFLTDLIDKCENSGLALVKSAYLESIEKFVQRPSIRLTVNNTLTAKEIQYAAETLEQLSSGVSLYQH